MSSDDTVLKVIPENATIDSSVYSADSFSTSYFILNPGKVVRTSPDIISIADNKVICNASDICSVSSETVNNVIRSEAINISIARTRSKFDKEAGKTLDGNCDNFSKVSANVPVAAVTCDLPERLMDMESGIDYLVTDADPAMVIASFDETDTLNLPEENCHVHNSYNEGHDDKKNSSRFHFTHTLCQPESACNQPERLIDMESSIDYLVVDADPAMVYTSLDATDSLNLPEENGHVHNSCSEGHDDKKNSSRFHFNHTLEKPYGCKLRENFIQKKNNNFQMSTSKKLIISKTCKEYKKNRNILNNHVICDPKEKSLCGLCKTEFCLKHKFDAHHVIHNNEKSHLYNVRKKHVSPETINGSHNLNENKTSQVNRIYQSFNKKRCLAEHQNSSFSKEKALDEKVHICEVCKKVFDKESTLTVHYLIHKDRSNVCRICLQTFTHRLDLVNHMKLHVAEKNLVCHICNHDFPCKSSLLTHLLSHTGEKPFACEVCGKSFSQKGNLMRHSLTHGPKT